MHEGETEVWNQCASASTLFVVLEDGDDAHQLVQALQCGVAGRLAEIRVQQTPHSADVRNHCEGRCKYTSCVGCAELLTKERRAKKGTIRRMVQMVLLILRILVKK